MNSKKAGKSKLTSSTPTSNLKNIHNRHEKCEHSPFENPQMLSDSYIISAGTQINLPNKKTPAMLDLVCEAIKVTGVPSKGSSYISIRKWISNNDSSTRNLTSSLRRAIENGLDRGVLGRAPRYKNVVGLRGWFILKETNSPKKEKLKKVLVNKGLPFVAKTVKAKRNLQRTVSDSEVTIHEDKKPLKRLNLSDTTIMEDGKKVAASTKVTKPKVTKPKVTKPKVTKPKITKPKVAKPRVNPKRVPKIADAKKAVPVIQSEKPSNGIAEASNGIEEASNGIEKPKAPKSKPVAKRVNSKVQAKTIPKKLYSSIVKPDLKNLPRKDLSDTELEVKPPTRKSLKSYSSDTDINKIGSKELDVNYSKLKRKGNKVGKKNA